MATRKIYILAGGGTGGHLYPGLAVAEQLTALDGDALVVFACSNRQIDERILEPFIYPKVAQPIKPLPRSARGWGSFISAYLRSMAQARRMVADLKPTAVLGLGGFAAAPIIKTAAANGIRTGLLNPDAIPGVANRHLARRVDAVFTQFESTADEFPPHISGVIHCVGCPVRPGLVNGNRDEAIKAFDLNPDRKTLLILGGSLGAVSINEAVAAIAGDLNSQADRWQLLHVTGQGGQFNAEQAFDGQDIGFVAMEYCDRMDLAYAASDLAICRGGASTIAELAATGTPAIIFPYPHHRDQHQAHNAAALVAAGGAICVEDARNLTGNVASLRATLLPLLSDDAKLRTMTESLGPLAKPRAAGDVAEWLVG